MYSLIILLSRGRMSDYADFNSNGSVALHIIVILVIAGFFLYAYIRINRTNINKWNYVSQINGNFKRK